MLGQVDIGTLAQRRTNGWQMVGPTLAHRRPNIGMFMGMLINVDCPEQGPVEPEAVKGSTKWMVILHFDSP